MKTKKNQNKIVRGLLMVSVIFVFLSASFFQVQAAVNKQINYQGKLTNTTGWAVPDGNYDMHFKIYDAATNGSLLWTGNYTAANGNAVVVSRGIFSILLGSGTGNALSLDFSSDTYYLQAEIYNTNTSQWETFNNRKRFGSVPQAINSLNVIGDGNINISNTSPSQSAASITYNPATGANSALAVTYGSGGGSGTALNVLQSGSGYSATFMGGNVGIGTVTPSALLDITGSTTTATGASIVNKNTSGTSAEYIKNSITSGALANGLLFENTGTGTMTNAISILETAGTVATGINIGNGVTTGISIGTGVTTGISIASGGITISGGGLAINNATGITSNQATLLINAGGLVDVQDTLNVDALTADTGGITIAAGQAYTGTGAVNISSGAGTGLTINSGTNGAIAIGDDASNETINIGTGGAVKTIMIGSTNTTSATTVQSGSGGINLQADNSFTGNVQIGTGGVGTATPDLLKLDVRDAGTAGDPAGTDGAMYYSKNANSFRCYQNGAWTNCIGTGSGGSPGGSNTQVQYNNGVGGFGADSGLTFNSSTQTLGLNGTDAEITMNGVTNNSPAPAADKLNIYAKSIAGRMMPKWVGPSGVDTPFQAALFQNAIYMWTPTTATAGLWTGTAGRTPAGTYSTLLPTTTNIYTMMKRGNWTNVATTANQMVGPGTSEALFQRGGSASKGGFFFAARFGLSAFTSGSRLFIGLSSSATTLTGNPSAITNMVGFGVDAGETAFTFMHNDGSGTATKDAISGQPALAANQGFDVYIFAKPNDTTIYWRLDNSSTGATIASGSVTSDLPVTTTNTYGQAVAGNAALTGAGAVGIGVARIYIETDE